MEMFKEFVIRDSRERKEFESGMVRDSGEKVRYNRCLDGSMFKRWGAHLQKGAEKYPDVAPGQPNWMLACGEEELQRFKESALGHMVEWLAGDTSEDHASAIFFNINGAEYVKEVLRNGRGNQKDTAEGDPSKVGC